MIVEKPKNQPESKLPLYIAQVALFSAVLFLLSAVFRVDGLLAFVAPFGGFVMTFFWPMVALLALLFVMNKEYQRRHRPRSLYVVRMLMLAVLLVGAGSVYNHILLGL